MWADPASRRPPIHIPTTFRYIFVRNCLSSTSPARYVAACASFSTYQPLSIGWSNVTYFFSIVRGKATSWSRILYSLCPKIFVIEMDVSRCILVLDTSILITSNSGSTWFKQEIKWGWGNLVCTSDLVQTGWKGGESSTDLSSNRSLGRKGKYRGKAVHSGMTRTRFAIHT